MGTKNDPGKFDCYSKALPDEPTFTLLARDPDFARLVYEWANKRQRDIECGERPLADFSMVEEARSTAANGQTWRRLNLGAWRK